MIESDVEVHVSSKASAKELILLNTFKVTDKRIKF